MTKAKISDRDNGYKEFRKTMESMRGRGPSVSVGILQKDGAKKHGDATIAEIATFHEFGIGVPERSWLRGWFDENRESIKREIRKAGKAVIEGRLEPAAALDLLGQKFVGDIKARISSGADFEPLAESTIARKGSTRPLIDTGRMIGAISHEVNK